MPDQQSEQRPGQQEQGEADQQGEQRPGQQEQEKAGQQEETKDLAFYIQFIRRNPWPALGFVVLAAIGAFAWGLGEWIGGKAGSIAQAACELAYVCPASTPPVSLPWEIKFSTAVPHCLTGRLIEKLRDWSPPVSWEAGADRLVICANATIEGPKQEIPRLIQKRFPRCINVETSETSIVARTKFEANAICRAPYRYDGDTLVNAPLRAGLFVCFPGVDLEGSKLSFSFAGAEVPVCSDDVMREYNFINQ